MSEWLLTQLEIEGFRGINNEGDALVLNFDPNRITSISSLNAVGKSSIYEAVGYVFRGFIPKLKALHPSENPDSYYINRFFSGPEAVVRVCLHNATSGQACTIVVSRNRDGHRTISSTDVADPGEFLRSLDRSFILLDYATLQTFMQDSPLERGRSFSKLLGLVEYSELRAKLRALANTNAFNNYFDPVGISQRKTAANKVGAEKRGAAYKSAATLCNVDPSAFQSDADVADGVLLALKAIPVLDGVIKCDTLGAVDFDACFAAISEAEGGEDRKNYIQLSQSLDEIKALGAGDISASTLVGIGDLARAYSDAMAETAGAIRQRLLEASREVLQSADWPDVSVCPTCDRGADFSVLEFVEERLSQYAKADTAAATLKGAWSALNWKPVEKLESKFIADGEKALFSAALSTMNLRSIRQDEVKELGDRLKLLVERHAAALGSLEEEVQALEAKLPKKLVLITQSVGEAKAIATSLADAAGSEKIAQDLAKREAIITSLKAFLDQASVDYSAAEGITSRSRMEAVLPAVQKMFCAIMTSQVVPTLKKSDTGEELELGLESFWSEKNLDALPLLSESYKNALAISIFMSAASLYSGPPRFVILDDVTSSFDGGSQFFTMQTLRKELVRPAQATGLQLIVLSHDPLLEKYFIKAAADGDWDHQRIEGTPRTIVMISGAGGAALRAKLVKLLDSGIISNVDAGVRQYLEFKLLEIIDRLKIRVPLSFAIDDNKKMVQNAIDAINENISLFKAAGALVLTGQQQADFTAGIATIVGNFLSHYETSQTGAIGEPALRNTILAIDALDDCFSTTNAAGHKTRYKALDRVV
ncbi:MAG TPA: AAA family ATPase [Allosphingosinicella sp.]|nr:AAA family ATPase [Allosphingosinicella sp.]